ncbi:hypothetical protein AVEN_25486-1 [Araneus ventricosus]|uniref:Uncharacterized protein n=1 Tax=Araneus ventricosus TaxID=182803 RepID=A0A4Y2CS44_ARAVE|nr:hypothetical protein AVEN_25486-1 [Araneus ventricosus]
MECQTDLSCRTLGGFQRTISEPSPFNVRLESLSSQSLIHFTTNTTKSQCGRSALESVTDRGHTTCIGRMWESFGMEKNNTGEKLSLSF